MAKFKIKCAPLPLTFRGTPQEFMDLLIDGMEITSDAQGFSTSPTMPEGNVGPWFRNGMEPYVWDEDLSTYVALDLSSSHPPQIFAGETAPNPEEFPLWLKLSGSTVVGLFNFAEGEWVAEASGLADGSIGTVELANGSVTGRKVKPLAITEIKMSAGLELVQWEDGTTGDFVRVDPTGQFAAYRKVHYDSGDLAFAAVMAPIEVPHGLAVPPLQVQLVAYNKTASAIHGVEPGEEVVFDPFNGRNGYLAFDNEVLRVQGGLSHAPAFPDGTTPNGSLLTTEWGFRIYYSAP